MTDPKDPFKQARETDGVMKVKGDGEDVTLLLKLKDVRKAAKDWQQFSSDHPFRVLIHSEKDVRSVRQLPIEIDPPDHTDYRAVVEPLFRRPAEPGYIEEMEQRVGRHVEEALDRAEMDVIQEFSLPLQASALTQLFRLPESEAEEWVRWGVHVFDNEKTHREEGHFLENYTARKFKEAEENPGHDFFSLLNQAEFRGRRLTFEEKQGFANVAFAGGKDTVISTVTYTLVHLAEHPESLERLRRDPKCILTATEEMVRVVSPITAIARTCPHGAEVGGHRIPENGRVGLCWPSANQDADIFDCPEDVRLDRSPNPHIGFGFGPHGCLGAPHARLILRSLLKALCEKVSGLELISAEEAFEQESSFRRQSGYERVVMRFHS